MNRTKTTTPDEAATARSVAESTRRRVHTLRAGRVLSYTVDPPSADVQLVHREWSSKVDGSAVAEPIAPLLGIPVLWPSGGGRGMVWGLVAGDPVYVAVREIEHDGWDAGQRGDDQTPTDDRRHDWSDAVVLPMDTLVGRNDGSPVIVLDSDDVLRVGALNADEPLAVASALREELDAIWSAIYGGHTHSVTGTCPSGGGPLSAGTALAASGTAVTRDLDSRRLMTDDTVMPGVGVVG